MAKKLKSLTSFITPIIRVDGQKSALEKLLEGDPDEMPELKSVGFARVSNANHSWVSYTITSRGKEIINIEVSEPDMRDIAEESAKIAFVEKLVDPGTF